MNYLSVCSGIEAATVAWHNMGWKPVGFSEIEKFPSQVLAHHYPEVTNYGDMTKFKEWNINEPVNLLVGGTPCQSFSVAGLRKGLDDPRGNLMLTFLAIADHYKPKWIVWENVPGVLSSNGGKDFGTFLGALGEIGYGFAYRVLDAQYFGVAQRRRRVFVVGCFGDWRSAAAVLFDSESLRGNPAPSREKREDVANWPANCAGTLNASFGTKQGLENQHINSGAPLFVPSYGIPGNWIGRKPENGGNAVEPMHDVSPCLTKTDRHGVAHAFKIRGGCEGGGKGYLGSEESAFTLSTTQDQHLFYRMAVRRLTPTECERLQGFPDGYTDIQPNDKPTADGPRYKALGNSMAVPVMKWIGERINFVDKIK